MMTSPTTPASVGVANEKENVLSESAFGFVAVLRVFLRVSSLVLLVLGVISILLALTGAVAVSPSTLVAAGVALMVSALTVFWFDGMILLLARLDRRLALLQK